MIFIFLLFMFLPLTLFILVIVMAVREGRRSAWRFRIGDVIGGSFATMVRMPLVIVLPVIALSIAQSVGMQWIAPDASGLNLFRSGSVSPLAWTGIILIILSVGQLIFLLLVRAALDAAEGQPVDVAAMIADCIMLTPKQIAVVVLGGLTVLLGFLFLIVPGIVLICLWVVVTPVLVREHTGVLGTFGRSVALTQGTRWRIALLGIVTWFLLVIFSLMIALLAATIPQWGEIAVQALSGALQTLLTPAMLATIYHELRSAKEGSSHADLETVFA